MKSGTKLPRLEYVGDVYRPSDDTWLLLGVIEKSGLREKLCLDLGAGSGILGIFALLNGACERVIFIDVMEDAAETTEINVKINGVHHLSIVVLSDDVVVEEVVDAVFANPPYLPAYNSRRADIATEGGPEGYETVMYFIYFANMALKHGGKLYLTYSSLSKPEIIQGFLKVCGFRVNYMESNHFFYETIYVVECVKL